MKIISGLGNPGKKFEKTWHNVGFLILDEFQKRNNFPKFKLVKKFESKISKKKFESEKIILVKPQTFMNNSGRAIKLLIENYKLKIENLIIVHDDIDVPLGKIKISFGKGSAGHKGVQSIIDELKTKNFIRIRVGICPKSGKPKFLEKFVLKKIKKGEQKILKELLEKVCEVIEILLKESLEKAIQKFN
jgi:PTH1 family peptidyl-tRNA hydrolase